MHHVWSGNHCKTRNSFLIKKTVISFKTKNRKTEKQLILGGKSCRLAVGGLQVRSHPGRVEVSLSKTPNPQLLLTSWLVPCMAANRCWCVSVSVCEWLNERQKLYRALDKGTI